ncbi:MAG: tetratricopeptide repeat protein [Acidimicrobiia bacterium]
MARQSDHNHKSNKSRGPSHGGQKPRPHQTITSVTSGQLPKWVREEIVRSTPKDRREPALGHLSKGMQEFADERYGAALPELRSAKELSPRSSTVRELLGLSAYRSGRWEEGLRELRTFRRITGDLIHMPVEMDCLRALGRKEDVTKTWDRIQEHDISATVSNEARVVYASFLLDEGKAREAWPIIKPGRLIASPSPGEIRRWYVAAKVALEAGDKDAARRIVAALDEQEPDFEGVDELRQALT